MVGVKRVITHDGSLSRSRAAILEFSLMASLFVLYYVTRGVAAGRAYDAFQNAFLVMRIEQALGLAAERAVQNLVLAYPLLLTLLNGVYTYTHLAAVLLFGIWAFFRVPDRYGEVRATFLAILAVGLTCYALFPLAPPRFFPWRGFVDTLAISRGVNYDHPGIASLYNPFAAMPSLHVAFAVFVCIGLLRLSKQRVLHLIGIVYAALMTIAVIGTGNHYVLDCIAGTTLAIVAWSLVPRLLPRLTEWSLPPVPVRVVVRHR
ncbi:phosphatase PAP2 family protein [Thermomicrobium sp. 4228-Ro]|uniref:phosphatase PAP2 family protein n=1 Tax=Thermomicrobium sp. 4228-Ro TaxID=2993937 RepID=UPI002248BF2A|nr:phosphatase PAP2 family protein [Thermomicrobium sp. 4228-Ro]MCX2727907.1 phosphatase PAP2 family protein [Thermomicrobium sp. 4228-Ro]